MPIKLSISGIRGQFDELTPDRMVRFAQAFATYIGGGTVALGRDARPSGGFMAEAVTSGLMAGGSDVYDYGIIPTPVLQWMTRNYEFDGGVSITAGHNSFDWNSLIFLDTEGAYLNHLQGAEFFNLFHSGEFDRRAFNRLGVCHDGNHKSNQKGNHKVKGRVDAYFEALKPPDNGEGRPLKFIIDCSSGFDAQYIEKLSAALGIRGVPIFGSNERFFRKDPEPNVKNAAVLGTIVRETGSDGGFMLNSNADRVLVVDERGNPLSEELTLPLFAQMVLEDEQSDIVTNYSTSRTVDMVAKKFGSRVFRTDVGQPFVVQMTHDLKTVIGGEGSGSVVYTPFSFGFDAFVFIRRMVGYLRKHRCSISSLAEAFKPPDIYKETLFLPPNRIYTLLEKIGNQYPGKKSLKDGFYIEDGSDWLCIRASATVSMIRIVGEGKSIREEITKLKGLVS